jgi:hypothetical protein
MTITINDGASPKTVQGNIARIGAFVDDLSSTGAGHTTTLAALSATNVTQDTKLASVSATNISQNTQLASISATNITQGTQLTSASSRIVGLESRIATLEAFMSSHG